MSKWFVLFLPLLVVGCNKTDLKVPPSPEPISSGYITVPEPPEFSSWPSTTKKRFPIDHTLSTLCRRITNEEEKRIAKKTLGQHAGYDILVRVSPNAIDDYQKGELLPIGAKVVKEKYKRNSSELEAYAVMIKREDGYAPETGNWEYAFVTLKPEKDFVRGRLHECASCHASVQDRDYLFRYKGDANRD